MEREHRKKMAAPIVITVLFVLYLIAYAGPSDPRRRLESGYAARFYHLAGGAGNRNGGCAERSGSMR